MTLISNDPAYWPFINASRISSYVVVAASVGVTYDWALSFGQEVELVWRQRWSLMTVLYLSVRYLGILYIVPSILVNVPTIFVMTDAVSCFMYGVTNWTIVVVFPMLCVIMITRLHAMYQRSKKILISLVVIFLAFNIFDGAAAVIFTRRTSEEEFILSGTYVCAISYTDDTALLLGASTWILSTVWEVLTLCLAAWIAVKHFREQRQHSAGGIIRDSFMVLITSHVLYVASFVADSCFTLIYDWSPTTSEDPLSFETQIYGGLLQIFQIVQMFVLGPRLILCIREYHAKLVADSDAATGMTSIVFQERIHISTGSAV